MSEIPVKFSLDEKFSFNITTIKYLEENFDNIVEVTGKSGNIIKKIQLREIFNSWFIKKELAPDFVHIIVTDSIILEVFSKINLILREKIDINQCFFERFNNSYTPIWKWIILGSIDSYSEKHCDMYGTSSWNYLVKGSKNWTLYLPSKIDAPEKKIKFKQESGDLIWIPENIYHEVEYLEESICLSQNLILERSQIEIINNILEGDSYEANFINTLKYLKYQGA